eukprot:6183304-Pleurochrysis_carterae.AAC.2
MQAPVHDLGAAAPRTWVCALARTRYRWMRVGVQSGVRIQYCTFERLGGGYTGGNQGRVREAREVKREY